MLAKKYKLPSSSFRGSSRLYRSGRFLTVNLSKSPLLFSRFGVVVSLKYDKRATVRHRLKREIFEFIRKKEIFRAPGRNVVVIIKKGVTSTDEPAIIKEVSLLLSNL